MREWMRSRAGAPSRRSGAVALVVDADSGSRRELASDMRELGIGVVEAASPLEAIDALDRRLDPIDMVVVAPTICSTTQAALAGFIAETYPELSHVLVRGQHWRRDKADHRWLLFDLQGELVSLPDRNRAFPVISARGRRRRMAFGSGVFRAVKPRMG